jgi:hypothetical protein
VLTLTLIKPIDASLAKTFYSKSDATLLILIVRKLEIPPVPS